MLLHPGVDGPLGTLFQKHLPTWKEAQNDTERFVPLQGGKKLLDTEVYKARMTLQAEALISEANARAKDEGKKVRIHRGSCCACVRVCQAFSVLWVC